MPTRIETERKCARSFLVGQIRPSFRLSEKNEASEKQHDWPAHANTQPGATACNQVLIGRVNLSHP